MKKRLLQQPRDRRFELGPMGIVLLLVLPAAGLALLAGMRERAPEFSEPRPAGSGVGNYSRAVAEPMPSLQEIFAHPDHIPSHDHPLVGRQAPDFALDDSEGKSWDLEQLRAGGSLVLIFYHGYQCRSCVRQLFDVDRHLPLFREVDARVAAISADPPETTRQRFQQYGRFGFPVLSDPGDKVRQAYQVFRRTRDGKRAHLLRHGTFLIDRQGTVSWANVGDAPFHRNPALVYHLAKREGRLPKQPGNKAEPRP